jgi:predicted glycoside hydrolase/deacetylase ChbG (UPF0249 family)
MNKIIINADDFGISDQANKAIKEYIHHGFISSTTIITNTSCVGEALKTASMYNNISYGVHLCIDEFKSLTQSEVLLKYGIIDNDNIFKKNAIYNISKPDNILIKAIYDELYEQVSMIYNNNIILSHIDSHHHFHTTNLWILDIIKIIADEFDIKYIRRPFSNMMIIRKINKNNYCRDTLKTMKTKDRYKSKSSKVKRGALFIKKYIKEKIWLSKASKLFSTTDKFYSYDMLYNNYDILKPYIQNKTIELMCHPGHPDYKTESDHVKKKLLKNIMKYKLMTYRDII